MKELQQSELQRVLDQDKVPVDSAILKAPTTLSKLKSLTIGLLFGSPKVSRLPSYYYSLKHRTHIPIEKHPQEGGDFVG